MGLLAVAVLVTSCSNEISLSSTDDPQGEWQLVAFELNDGTEIQVPNPAAYMVNFGASGEVRIVADCNNCGSSYATDGTNLAIGLLACTRAACLPGSFFDQYTAALDSASAFERRGNTLFSTYSGGTMRFAAASLLGRA